jgi:hypothetical protein
MDDPLNASSWINSIWSALLTAFAALIFWNGKTLVKQIDAKADKDELDEHKDNVRRQFEQVQVMLNRLLDKQDQQHAQNTTRLDMIISKVFRNNE